MASALPHRPSVDHAPREQTTVAVHGDEPADVLQVVASDTAQELLSALRDNPSPASDLADTVGTSLQNVQYHLDRLREAGLIDAVETWYSSRGTEMTVYALATEQLVVSFDADSERPGVSARTD